MESNVFNEHNPQKPAAAPDVEQKKVPVIKMNLVIFMTLFMDLVGFTVILPLMPKLLEYYGKDGTVSSILSPAV